MLSWYYQNPQSFVSVLPSNIFTLSIGRLLPVNCYPPLPYLPLSRNVQVSLSTSRSPLLSNFPHSLDIRLALPVSSFAPLSCLPLSPNLRLFPQLNNLHFHCPHSYDNLSEFPLKNLSPPLILPILFQAPIP